MRDALSQLQMAYVQPAATRRPPPRPPAGARGVRAGGRAPSQAKPEGPGQAQQSGRLWIPGQ